MYYVECQLTGSMPYHRKRASPRFRITGCTKTCTRSDVAELVQPARGDGVEEPPLNRVCSGSLPSGANA
jgi:hypothetical protein